MELEVKTTEIISNVMGEEAIPMTIDNENIKYIIRSLTNIYPNKVLACLREYSCNGLDSHIVAGQTRPVEVTLPSSFNPNFVVQDWGTGMGRYELEKIYGVYGASTKRKSKDTIGAFGLGSKSALTLVDSFNLVSVKDGRKFTAIVNKNSEGVGQLKILSEVATTEPNGVKVTIPAAKPAEFSHLAKTFFMSWKPGTVLVNGEEPMMLESDNFERVGDIGYISRASRSGYGQRGSLTVSMGGVCYKVGSLSFEQQQAVYGANTSYHLRQQEIILNAPLGDVELVPSREEVEMSDKTLDFIEKRTKELIREFLSSIKKKIDTAPTRMEAIRLVEQFPFAYSRSEYTWQGNPIPAHVDTTWAHWSYSSHSNRKTKYADHDAQLKLTTEKEPCVLIDTEGATIETSTIMRHLKTWAKAENIMLSTVYIGRKPAVVDPWMQAMIDERLLIVESATDVAEKAKAYNKANRKAREVSTEPRDTLRYPAYTVKNVGDVKTVELDHMTVAEIKKMDETIYFLDQDTVNLGGLRGMDFSSGDAVLRNVIRNYLPAGSTLVVISNSRKSESFVKRLGDMDVRDVMGLIEEKITAELRREVSLADELTERIAAMNNARIFKKFAGKEIDSEVFSAVVKNLVDGKTDTGLMATYKDAYNFLGWYEDHANKIRYNGGEVKPTDSNMVRNFIAHYPLFSLAVAGLSYNGAITDEVVDALVEYLNKAHAEKGEFSL